MSFDLTSRNKDYKSLDKRWVMGLMGQMSFTLSNDTRRIIMYDELLYCIVSIYLYIRYRF